MKKLIHTEQNPPWIDGNNNTVETWLSDELPDVALCTAAYSFVFKDGAFLMTELREGERPVRQLDIPGGHIDEGETPSETAVRETFEETGVRITNPRLVVYVKITTHVPKPDNPKYPYPTTYMVYYAGDVLQEEFFEGNDDTHGRVWLPPEEFHTSEWCVKNKILLDAVIASTNFQ